MKNDSSFLIYRKELGNPESSEPLSINFYILKTDFDCWKWKNMVNSLLENELQPVGEAAVTYKGECR